MKIIMRSFVGLCGLLVLTSCSSFLNRQPASVSETDTYIQGLESAIASFSTPVTADSCGPLLERVEDKVMSLNWSHFSNDELRSMGPVALSQFWQLRLKIHGQLENMNKGCVVKTRELFHQIRDQEDYFGEFTYNVKAVSPADLDFFSQPVPIYDRKFYPPYLVRSDLDDSKFQFQAGDLMLARGISFFSAIISQVGDKKSAYSHVVVLNKDAKTQKVNTIESYIGAGVDRYDIDYALRNENARLLVLRPKDASLGANAASLAMSYAKQRLGYDYVMNYADYSKMSCVEVARAAYDKASHGKFLLPSEPSSLNLKNKDFMDKMGLKNGRLITPDDIEVDSRFELVLDWRDYRLIRDSRHKDAVLNEFMRWMNDLGYNFHGTAKSVLATDVLLPARTTKLWPFIRKVTGVPDIDPLLPKKTLGIMTVMNQVASAALEQLERADNAYIAKYGRPMDNAQLREAVDLIRSNDLLIYRLGLRTSIHYAFRPDSI